MRHVREVGARSREVAWVAGWFLGKQEVGISKLGVW